MNIIDFIPYGHKNAISRRALRDYLHTDDRNIRKAIEEANLSGECIINTGSGYFRYKGKSDDAFFADYIAKERSRCRQINRKIRKMIRSKNAE